MGLRIWAISAAGCCLVRAECTLYVILGLMSSVLTFLLVVLVVWEQAAAAQGVCCPCWWEAESAPAAACPGCLGAAS